MPMDADRFWCFDGDMMHLFRTAEEAQAECERALDYHRDAASDDAGWAEEVESIMWGPIAGRVVETDRAEHLPGCTSEEGCEDGCRVGTSRHDYWVDYALVEVTDGR